MLFFTFLPVVRYDIHESPVVHRSPPWAMGLPALTSYRRSVSGVGSTNRFVVTGCFHCFLRVRRGCLPTTSCRHRYALIDGRGVCGLLYYMTGAHIPMTSCHHRYWQFPGSWACCSGLADAHLPMTSCRQRNNQSCVDGLSHRLYRCH